MIWNRSLAATSTALALGLAVAGSAWVQTPDRDRVARQETQERLLHRFLDHAAAELNLSGQQRDELTSILQETMGRRRDLTRRQIELRGRIREGLADPDTEEATFRRHAEEITTLKREEAELLAWQRERLQAILTARQTVRFLLMQERLAQRVERMRRGGNR